MNETPPDYGLLDRAGADAVAFYPRPERSTPPPGATDFAFEVEPGVAIHARLYVAGRELPTLLYFHGNGEIVPDHDGLAPYYANSGLNLFVFEFRGYGMSSGRPTFASLVSDAHVLTGQFHATLDQLHFAPARFVMGRSLGAHSALEIAANAGDRFRGLIIESGAGLIRLFLGRLEVDATSGPGSSLADAHDAKIRSISLPALIIHGERDELVPLERAKELSGMLTQSECDLVVIRGAGHNDLTWVGAREYFDAIRSFVDRHR